MTTPIVQLPQSKEHQHVPSAVVRFSGDSGDGMQLTGTQFTHTAALFGNDLATFPDFPAEIRAPAGTTFGVSGFQIHFGTEVIFTPGDRPDVLIAMNPAALKVNVGDLKPGGVLIVNSDAFTKQNLQRAGYIDNPLDDHSLDAYRTFAIDITAQVERALEPTGLSFKEVARTKNFWTLGLVYYLFSRKLEPTLAFIEKKFAKTPQIAEGHRLALKAGYLYGEVSEIFQHTYEIEAADLEPGLYRNITGNQATAWGALAASEKAGLPLFYGSYPITPASDVLHELSRHKRFGVKTLQAEDEIAAVGSAIGAAYGGNLALTGSSGPGIALKTEAIGLAVATELPLVVLNVQRGGPSTGLPTKTEQADLMQALYGRNGECPVVVVAPRTPSDCFVMMMEAFRLSLKAMVPVFVLSDGYLANGSEPWRIPEDHELPDVQAAFHDEAEGFHAFLRDPDSLARVWAIPGTPGLEHRIGGIEKDHDTGNISYDPDNHQRMTEVRQAKIDRLARDIPPQGIFGDDSGDVLIVSWGSTYGAVREAVHVLREQKHRVSHVHLRYLNPFPSNLGEILSRFERVIVPEMNYGQLSLLLRARYLVDAESLPKVTGRPFSVEELIEAIDKREKRGA
jgi:2-oxoglutarate ferredoxin oxidoreductase subunit alpha